MQKDGDDLVFANDHSLLFDKNMMNRAVHNNGLALRHLFLGEGNQAVVETSTSDYLQRSPSQIHLRRVSNRHLDTKRWDSRVGSCAVFEFQKLRAAN